MADKCKDTEHNFELIPGGSYFKGNPPDQSKSYSTMFCKKCGEAKEIIVRSR